MGGPDGAARSAGRSGRHGRGPSAGARPAGPRKAELAVAPPLGRAVRGVHAARGEAAQGPRAPSRFARGEGAQTARAYQAHGGSEAGEGAFDYREEADARAENEAGRRKASKASGGDR